MRHLVTAAVILGAILLYASAFTVAEYQYAAKFKLGAIVETDYEPGLHWQMPIVNNVVKFDRRILSMDASAERFITSEKKDVIVDSFVKWRIDNVRDYYRATRGDMQRASARLAPIIADGLRSEFSKRTLKEVVSTEREEIMSSLTIAANETARSLGIKVVDVRVKRIDLPGEVSSSVFRRMRAERLEVANQLRSQGEEEKQIIQAEADREARVILATAERDSQIMRGEGDAEAARLYAQAYERSAEFYAFYRSLQAYRNTFGGSRDMILLDSSSEFFEYFKRTQVGEQP